VSQENVDSVRRGVDALNRRDRAAFLALCEPELENIPPRDWPESQPIRGREAVWDFYIEGNAPWDQTSFEFAEIMEVGDDKVVGDLRQEVQGKASGAQVVWAFWLVATLREGRVVRNEFFRDRAEALKAVGLEE
jgi:ketosteroid isomerase-like protein